MELPEHSNTVELSVEDVVQRLKSSYAEFCRFFQDDTWFDPIHEMLCNWMQYHTIVGLEDQKDVKFLIIMPRGSLKTTIVTKYYPLWLTVNDPNLRTLIVMNTFTNATKKLVDTRGLFDSDENFRGLFPELLPPRTRDNRWTSDCLEINRPKKFPEGTFEAAGVGTRKISAHYNCIIEDDTVAPDESEMKEGITLPSLDRIRKGIGYHQVATGLLMTKGVRIRVVVSTRWGEYDLVSHIRDEERGYKVFDVPAIQNATMEDWKEKTPLFSMFYTKEKLEEIEEQMGPYMFACLYLNKPQDASLRSFKDDWFHYVTEDEIPKDGEFTIAVDPAISEEDKACESSITVVKHCMENEKHPHQYWYEDITGHFDPYQTVNKTLNHAELLISEGENVKMIIVEEIAFQKALKYIFWDEMTKRDIQIPIVGFKSKQSKNTRIEGTLQPRFFTNRIHFVRGRFTRKAEFQIQQFPTGRLLDIIDSYSMHIKYYKPEQSGKSKPKSKEKKIKDSWEDALKDARKAYKDRNDLGALSPKGAMDTDAYAGSLKTGLGAAYDYGTMFRKS